MDLRVRLDFPLPQTLAVGRGTAVFVCGSCLSPDGRIESLDIVVDGETQPLMAHGMARRDVYEALRESPDDPSQHSFRSGFWGLARVHGRNGNGECELRLLARFAGGGEAEAELGRIPLSAPPQPIEVAPPAPEVAICMATYEPSLELFRRQVESIRAQTHDRWVCIVSDDCSSPARFAEMEAILAGDPRFVTSRSEARLGFYRNFERALSLVPADSALVAMADQDDYWQADKLEALLGEIGGAQLAYSDARVVARDGEVVSETYWAHRRNNHSDLASLLMANAVTGAASLFRREVLDYALPFPPAQFAHYHDHWIALNALALGDIAFVDRPLYDYVQHGEAVLGHEATQRMRPLRERIRTLRTDPRDRVRRWRKRFFVDNCRLLQFAAVLRMRCGERMTAGKRRALDRFLRADESLPALAGLGLRSVREFVGRPETLGAELALLLAFTWRRLLVVANRGLDRPSGRFVMDALPPASLTRHPSHRGAGHPAARAVADKITPLELAVRDDAPRRVNLLIPAIDLDHFFGGYIGKLNLARRLAERGARVRVLTVDPNPPLPSRWRRRLESYSGLAGLFDRIEVEFGRESEGIEVSRSDRFIATTWWTAHIARAALDSLGGGRPLYLIQEYEPFTFPQSTFAALAAESYRFPHTALFSSELLREYFRRHGIGVYAEGAEAGDAVSASFQNAITAVTPPSAAELAQRKTRRLLFYARPEPHAARNMFELGLLALEQAAESGAFGSGWELHGIGTVETRREFELAGGLVVDLLRRREQGDYGTLLREHDVGLALMYTPHPSLVPIEMASAGMLAVTNSFENKTAEALGAISPNLITAEPDIAGVAAALVEASRRVDDFERRAAGAAVNWSRDWDESFDDALMERIEGFLNA